MSNSTETKSTTPRTTRTVIANKAGGILLGYMPADSDPVLFYEQWLGHDGCAYCKCMAWRFSHGSGCKHTRRVAAGQKMIPVGCLPEDAFVNSKPKAAKTPKAA